MLTYKDILYSVTNALSKKYKNIDIIVQNEEGTFENECFYVTVIPLQTEVNSNTSNLKKVMISVKYFCNSDLKLYDVASELTDQFERTIKVKDRTLNISSTEANFLTDEVGKMLDFLITVKYLERVKEKEDNKIFIKDVETNFVNVEKIENVDIKM